MPRDYKKKLYKNRNKKTKPEKSGFGLIGLFSGILIGSLITIAAQHYQFFTLFPYSTGKVSGATLGTVKPEDEPKEETQVQDSKKTVVQKLKFEFYNILPEMEVVIPDQEVALIPDNKNKVNQKNGTYADDLDKNSTYVLQVGSFKTFGQADRRKAVLALLGVPSAIQTVTINKSVNNDKGNDTWHRVRVGPIKDPERLKILRLKLKKNGISVLVLKIKV